MAADVVSRLLSRSKQIWPLLSTKMRSSRVGWTIFLTSVSGTATCVYLFGNSRQESSSKLRLADNTFQTFAFDKSILDFQSIIDNTIIRMHTSFNESAFYTKPMLNRSYFMPVIHAQEQNVAKRKEKKVDTSHLSYRERRFLTFASVEFEGMAYMTPRDFLEAVTEEEPRPRIGRRSITKQEVDSMLRQTPKRNKGSSQLFRLIQDQGLLSYTEYLFLLCVLTKPPSGFQIAFNMFDTDGNSIVDKTEFLVMERSIDMMYRKKIVKAREDEADSDIEKHEPAPENVQNTTLLVHLFGQKGREALSFADFFKFMDDLQTEVLQLEFSEFSKGMPVISELEFARILLRYTYLSDDEHDALLQQLQRRTPEERGITFDEFKKFCQFLNTLDDFSIALSLYTLADRGVSQAEFQRAVRVSTGQDMNMHLINVVFNIFDKDGDGQLSYKEFIAIMKDRLHRGFRSHLLQNQSNWDTFKVCLRNEMRDK